MDYHLLEIVACPLCHGKLIFDKQQQALICKSDALAYPIRDGIPVLLAQEARTLTDAEKSV